MKIKAFLCLLICLTSLLTLSGCSQAFGHGWVTVAQQGPQDSPANCSHAGTTSSREVERGWDVSPAPLSLSPGCLALRNITPVAVQALGCGVADAQVHSRHSHGDMPGSCPPVAGITGPKLLAGVVALQSCLLLPPCPAATAAQLPPLLFVNR